MHQSQPPFSSCSAVCLYSIPMAAFRYGRVFSRLLYPAIPCLLLAKHAYLLQGTPSSITALGARL